MAARKRSARKVKQTDPEQIPDAEFDLGPGFDPDRDFGDIVHREARRSGPSTAARRALEALAESHSLNRELNDLENFEV
ncbi:MAG: hypothetical protein WBN65_16120 [Gammaproteobacteria bacterium]